MSTKALSLLALAALMASTGAPALAQSTGKLSPEQAREADAYTLGVQAYLWGFPLYFYEATEAVGAQLAEQVLYPNTVVDDKSEPFTGARKYVLHFTKGRIPPVATFWNLAMYDQDNLFVENDFGRYSIGSTTDGLKKNPAGSITLYIQKDRPPDTSNWLPAPAEAFNLTMRLYGPQTPILDGSYRLPAVRRAE